MADRLIVSGAREHNLRDVDLDLPRDRLIVFTGLSGSGKELAGFRHHLRRGPAPLRGVAVGLRPPVPGPDDKPDVDFIEGLSPAISIDQKSASRNPRSTVGTVTEVYDYLRLLYARIGVPTTPRPGSASSARPPADRGPHPGHGRGHPVPSAGPGVRGRKGTYDTLLDDLAAQGFARAVVDGDLIELGEQNRLDLAATRCTTSAWWWTAGAAPRPRAPAHRLGGDRPGPGQRVAEIEIVGPRPAPTDPSDAASPPGPPPPATAPKPPRSCSASTFPGPPTASPSRSWPPATSPSTPPTGPAPTATASAPSSRSIPELVVPDPGRHRRRGHLALGREPLPLLLPAVEAVATPTTSPRTSPGASSPPERRTCCSTAGG